jgi:uncharacterized protein (TIGR02118 family)
MDMIKMIHLITRKPGLSREEFRQHYEEVHAPLARKHFPTFRKYVRNHVISAPGSKEPDFDCITEIWFDSMQDCQAIVDLWKSEGGRIIRRDEENFMNRSKLVSFLVDERVSE